MIIKKNRKTLVNINSNNIDCNNIHVINLQNNFFNKAIKCQCWLKNLFRKKTQTSLEVQFNRLLFFKKKYVQSININL